MSDVIERLDTEVDAELADEEADAQLFKVPDVPVTVEIGDAAEGVPAYADAQYFAAISIEYETDDVTQAMGGPEHVNESAVFVANEEGQVGAGVLRVDEGTVEEAIEQFETEHL